MKNPLSLLLFLLATSLSAQTGPAFKGHHLGESTQNFLATEAAFRDRVSSCLTGTPKPLTPEQIHALSKSEEYDLSQQVFTSSERSSDSSYKWKSAPSRKELEEMARNGRPVVLDRRIPQESAFCNSLMAATEHADYTGTLSSPEVTPPVSWSFERGQLTGITIEAEGISFQDVATDLTAKLGARPVEGQTVDMETLGPTPLSQWTTPTVFARLEQRSGFKQKITVMTRASYDARVAAQKRPKPLD